MFDPKVDINGTKLCSTSHKNTCHDTQVPSSTRATIEYFAIGIRVQTYEIAPCYSLEHVRQESLFSAMPTNKGLFFRV